MTSTHPYPQPRRRAALAAAPAVLLLALAALLPTAAHAQTAEPAAAPATWSVRPADTVEGTGRPNFAYEAQPGSLIRDAITIANAGEQPLALGVYAADGLLTEDGTLDLLPLGEPSEHLGSWITIDADAIELAPGASRTVEFTVQVPDDASPGDYMAGVVSSLRTEDGGIVTERRLGSRVGLRVAGDLAPALAVSGLTIGYEGSWNPFAGGTATIDYTVANEGNARIAATEAVRATGPLGLWPVAAEPTALPELLPGTSVQRTVVLDGVPPLFWLGAELGLTGEVVAFGGGDAVAIDAVSALAGTAAVPWLQVLILLALAGLVVLALRLRKRASTRRIDAAVAAALAERDAADAPRSPVEPDVRADRAAADDDEPRLEPAVAGEPDDPAPPAGPGGR